MESHHSNGQSVQSRSKAISFDSFSKNIRSEVLRHTNGKKEKWISCSWCKPLLSRGDLNLMAVLKELKRKHTGWTNDATKLERFVLELAPQLFTMLVHTNTEQLLDQFCTKGIGDRHFPITEFQVFEERLEIGDEDTVTLKLGTTDFVTAENLLELVQKKFFVPRLCWPKEFEPPPFTTFLPYLAEPEEIQSSSFSVVSKCLVHRDYVTIERKYLVCTPNLVLIYRAEGLIR
jgi:hypothetical protein